MYCHPHLSTCPLLHQWTLSVVYYWTVELNVWHKFFLYLFITTILLIKGWDLCLVHKKHCNEFKTRFRSTQRGLTLISMIVCILEWQPTVHVSKQRRRKHGIYMYNLTQVSTSEIGNIALIILLGHVCNELISSTHLGGGRSGMLHPRETGSNSCVCNVHTCLNVGTGTTSY